MSTSPAGVQNDTRHIGPMIADSAELSLGYAERLLSGIPAESFARLACVVGEPINSNHPAFILGHLSLYPSRILSDLGLDAASVTPTQEELDLFDHNAQCVDDANGNIYPPMDQLVQRFLARHRQAIEAVRQADDARFLAPNRNESMRSRFATVGSMHGFYLGSHIMMHLGQLSAWRRMAGLGAA